MAARGGGALAERGKEDAGEAGAGRSAGALPEGRGVGPPVGGGAGEQPALGGDGPALRDGGRAAPAGGARAGAAHEGTLRGHRALPEARARAPGHGPEGLRADRGGHGQAAPGASPLRPALQGYGFQLPHHLEAAEVRGGGAGAAHGDGERLPARRRLQRDGDRGLAGLLGAGCGHVGKAFDQGCLLHERLPEQGPQGSLGRGAAQASRPGPRPSPGPFRGCRPRELLQEVDVLLAGVTGGSQKVAA
mmetsp:Transcript_58621/g.171566  ORF Transcript_58621/g.171566 Transcript_58621/m.171566 type:complete len:247 (+) Transcript_58621:705-1445(+)